MCTLLHKLIAFFPNTSNESVTSWSTAEGHMGLFGSNRLSGQWLMPSAYPLLQTTLGAFLDTGLKFYFYILFIYLFGVFVGWGWLHIHHSWLKASTTTAQRRNCFLKQWTACLWLGAPCLDCTPFHNCTLGRLRQDCGQFQTNVGYIARPCLNKIKFISEATSLSSLGGRQPEVRSSRPPATWDLIPRRKVNLHR